MQNLAKNIAEISYAELIERYGVIAKSMSDCKKWSEMADLNEIQAIVTNEIARRPEYRTRGIKRRQK